MEGSRTSHWSGRRCSVPLMKSFRRCRSIPAFGCSRSFDPFRETLFFQRRAALSQSDDALFFQVCRRASLLSFTGSSEWFMASGKVVYQKGVFSLKTQPNKSLERTARQRASHQGCIISLRLCVAGGQPLNSSVGRLRFIKK